MIELLIYCDVLKKNKKNNTNWAKTLGYSLEKPCSRINIVCERS